MDRSVDSTEVIPLYESAQAEVVGESFLSLECKALARELGYLCLDVYGFFGEDDGGFFFGSLLHKDLAHLGGFTSSDDDRRMRLDDARLLPSYCFERISEQLGMILTDAGDDGGNGGDDVGAVKSSTQPNLDDGEVYLCLTEVVESHKRRDLEEGGRTLFNEWLSLLYEATNEVFAHHLSIHSDALTEV